MQSKRLKLILYIAVLFSIAGVFAKNPVIRQVYCAGYLSKTPVIDGKVLNDPVWKNIRHDSDFIKLGTNKPAESKTFMQVAYDKDNLYFGIVCKDLNISKLKAVFKDGQALWKDDGIEFFINPDRSKYYYQLVQNTRGAMIALRSLKAWKPEGLKKATCIGKDYYSIELAIPFSAMAQKTPVTGDKWTFNIARNIYNSKTERHISWTHLNALYHELDNFGILIFSGKKNRTGQVKVEITELWREIKNYLNLCKKKNTIIHNQVKHLISENGYFIINEQVDNIVKLNEEQLIALKKELKNLSFNLPEEIQALEQGAIDRLRNSLFERQ